MEVRYYPDTDTAYIYLLEPGDQVKVEESEEVAPGVVVDFDGDERPVGIEIYHGARAKLAGVPPDPDTAERIKNEERERIRSEMERYTEGMMRALDKMFAKERERTGR